eukprot:ctg_42.g9
MAHGMGRAGDVNADQPRRRVRRLSGGGPAAGGHRHGAHAVSAGTAATAAGMSAGAVAAGGPEVVFEVRDRGRLRAGGGGESVAGRPSDENGTRDTRGVLCVISTTSCFAPRAPDDVVRIAQWCRAHDVPHVVNNAYGLQARVRQELYGTGGRCSAGRPSFRHGATGAAAVSGACIGGARRRPFHHPVADGRGRLRAAAAGARALERALSAAGGTSGAALRRAPSAHRRQPHLLRHDAAAHHRVVCGGAGAYRQHVVRATLFRVARHPGHRAAVHRGHRIRRVRRARRALSVRLLVHGVRHRHHAARCGGVL